MQIESQIESLLNRLDRLESARAISELRARYCQALDDGKWEELADTFTDDGVFIGLSTARGRSEMLEFFPTLNSKTVTSWWHFSSNETIEFLDSNNATGVTWLLQPCVVSGTSQIAAGRYKDHITRTPEGWRFKQRKVSFFFWSDLSKGWDVARFDWQPARGAADQTTLSRNVN